MPDGDHGHTDMIGRNSKTGAGFGGVKTAHLMGHQPQGRRLQAEVFTGGTGIVLAPTVRLAIGVESGRRHGQEQYRRVLHPHLVALRQTGKRFSPAGLIMKPIPDQIPPGLIAIIVKKTKRLTNFPSLKEGGMIALARNGKQELKRGNAKGLRGRARDGFLVGHEY